MASVSLVISCAALLIALAALLRQPGPGRGSSPFAEATVSLLEKGRDIERRGGYEEAVGLYELVPSAKKGGLANEYLEAQLRRAYICFKYLNQYTKARSVLESLRMEFSDPAVDAYLGQIYYRLALYNESRDRLQTAIASKKGSVISQTPEFRREIQFYLASAIDRQFTYLDNRNPALLMDAIKAWDYYHEYSACAGKTDDQDCKYAQERRRDLEKIDKQMKAQ